MGRLYYFLRIDVTYAKDALLYFHVGLTPSSFKSTQDAR